MNKKLSAKISFIVAIMVIIGMTSLITVAVILTSKTVSTGTNAEMTALAQKNAVQIQEMLNQATDPADDLWHFITQKYEGNGASETKTNLSEIYGTHLTTSAKAIESYAIEEAWRSVKSIDCLVGLGVFFEPYAFDNDIEKFAIYIDTEMAEKRTVSLYDEDYTTQNYYAEAIQRKQVVFTEPFMWGGEFMISVANPIEINGKVIGAVISDISLDAFSKIKTSSESHSTLFSSLISERGTYLYDSKNPDYIGKNLSQLASQSQAGSLEYLVKKLQEGKPFQMISDDSKGVTQIHYLEPINMSGSTWWTQTALEKSDFNSATTRLTLYMIGLAVVAIVIIISLTNYSVKKRINPIRYIVDASKKIEAGNLEFDLDIKSENEIGQLANSFENMSKGFRMIIGDITYILTEMANNNFSVKSENEDKYVGEYKSIFTALQNINHTLNTTLMHIREASDQVSSGSDQVSSGAQTLAQGATEQAASIEQLSASVTQVSSQIGETAKNANTASSITNDVSSVMHESLSEMHQLLNAMSDISKASVDIGKVIKVIDDIAFQTNILALNAAVEAARAGAAGKGFAVVADEVRNLAHKSSESAKNTTALIESTVAAVEKGVELATKTNQAFEDVDAKTSTMKEIVNEISEAAYNQSESISQILIGVEQISNVVQMNSATAEESAAASEELSAQAKMLNDLVSKFKLEQ